MKHKIMGYYYGQMKKMKLNLLLEIGRLQLVKRNDKEYDLDKICPILFSPVYDKINIENLSKWILDDGLNVRLQMQLHKYIWGADKKEFRCMNSFLKKLLTL